ncbi:MAG: UDP-N-acetylmuramate dehydrogenase [Patescibacteria group bacterium]
MIEKDLPGVQKNIFLKKYTTFKIGGKTKYFFVAKNLEDIICAISAAEKYKLPIFVLGSGSNLLVSDEGFGGMVIKNENCKLEIANSRIIAEAGTKIYQLVDFALKNNLFGLEWAAGIPGTLGGAICGNAGTFGQSMENIVHSANVLDAKKKGIKIFRNKDCKFGYRESIFKRNNKLIILSAEIQLKKGDKLEIKKEMKEFSDYRKEHQPLNFPSAGSIFKNGENFFAGELIEKVGLKGKRLGNAEISKKHANFIVNLGNASANDVKKLIALAKKRVKREFNVVLKEEIVFLPPVL